MSELQRTAATNRRRFLLAIVVGIPLAVVGAILTGRGTGEGPREAWFSTANWADWAGGVLMVVGALLVTVGCLGRRNG